MDSKGRIQSTEAARLARLRMLLDEAGERVPDRSELGRHLAIVMIDGVGELAIGLCLFRLSSPPTEKESVPSMLGRLLEKIGEKEAPGLQGYRELHRVRNLVQHEGILPAGEQLPRWFEDTERLIHYLVAASFGVELNVVASADAVNDPALNQVMQKAELSLENGEWLAAMESCWRALDLARNGLRRHTGIGTQAGVRASRPGTRELEELRNGLKTLSERWELSLFTGDPGEWMWFEQRYKDGLAGLSVDVGDARRAFVFVLDWILRAEAYIVRHGPERWQLWHQQSAPKTGLPGGPHIQDVSKHREFSDRNLWEWAFQLTDVPEGGVPGFDWGIQAAHEASPRPEIEHVYLDPQGRLMVRSPETTQPQDLLSAVRALIPAAKDQLSERAESDRQAAAAVQALLDPFLSALGAVGCGVKEASVRDDNGASRAAAWSSVWIRVEGMPESGMSSFPASSGSSLTGTCRPRASMIAILVSTTSPSRRVGHPSKSLSGYTPLKNAMPLGKRKRMQLSKRGASAKKRPSTSSARCLRQARSRQFVPSGTHMDPDSFIDRLIDWKEFELFVRDLYAEDATLHVEHDVMEVGKSGARRQIDVKFTHTVRSHTYVTLVECKRWKEKVGRDRVDILAASIEDLNASKGVIFTTTGFELGAREYAKSKGIDLFLVRDLTDSEWACQGDWSGFTFSSTEDASKTSTRGQSCLPQRRPLRVRST